MILVFLLSSISLTNIRTIFFRDWFRFYISHVDMCTLLNVVFSHCFHRWCLIRLAQPILLHALCSYARLFGALDVDTAPIALRLVARLLPLPGNQDRYGWLVGGGA
jgi:hypothetical protein